MYDALVTTQGTTRLAVLLVLVAQAFVGTGCGNEGVHELPPPETLAVPLGHEVFGQTEMQERYRPGLPVGFVEERCVKFLPDVTFRYAWGEVEEPGPPWTEILRGLDVIRFRRGRFVVRHRYGPILTDNWQLRGFMDAFNPNTDPRLRGLGRR